MKKMGVLPLAFTYVGCFLGAGFVSGQELWQFFGAFGTWGFVGYLVSAALFVFFGVVLMRLTQMTGYEELDRLLVPWEKAAWLRSAAGIITALFLFGVVVLMSAGVGAMLQQLFGISAWIGSAIFTLTVAVMALFGVSGMVSAFAALIPVLVAATVVFAVCAWGKFDLSLLGEMTNTNDNPLMPNWFIAALTFVAYNLLGGIGIMVPVGPLVRRRSTVFGGMLLSGVMLVVVACCILSSVAIYPPAVEQELPMVAVASALLPALGSVYGVLLALAMFCNSLASLVALMTYLKQKIAPVQRWEKPLLLVIAVVVWAGSLFGFGDIIGVIFPIFGYLSIVFLVTMVLHYIQCCRRERKK